jgi:hypothetical protein
VAIFRSDKSLLSEGPWSHEWTEADTVLDGTQTLAQLAVKDMIKYGSAIAAGVSLFKVDGALHDPSLSRSEVRKQFFKMAVQWLDSLEVEGRPHRHKKKHRHHSTHTST